jgi:hypothetical protein
MAANSVTLSAVGVSPPIRVELGRFKSGVGLIATVAEGSSLVYDVEVSGDDQSDTPIHWNKHDELHDLSASVNSNLLFPASFIRLNMKSGTGSVTLGVVQDY